jgi:predicted transcriptional regulator
MSITLTPKTESRLREQAERIGKDPNSLAEVLIADGLSNGAFLDDPDKLTDAEVAEVRAGIRRGLEAAAEGRVKPLAQAVAEARQRHGFPSFWAS